MEATKTEEFVRFVMFLINDTTWCLHEGNFQAPACVHCLLINIQVNWAHTHGRLLRTIASVARSSLLDVVSLKKKLDTGDFEADENEAEVGGCAIQGHEHALISQSPLASLLTDWHVTCTSRRWPNVSGAAGIKARAFWSSVRLRLMST